MGKEDFMEDLINILEIDSSELTDDLVLDSENWNSLSIVTAIVAIDEHFGFTIEGEKLRQCDRVGKLMELIEAHLEK
jgi:acyl carrier protein